MGSHPCIAMRNDEMICPARLCSRFTRALTCSREITPLKTFLSPLEFDLSSLGSGDFSDTRICLTGFDSKKRNMNCYQSQIETK